MNHDTATNWCVFNYEGKEKIVLKGKGEGGHPEMISTLDDDAIYYGGFRCYAVDSKYVAAPPSPCFASRCRNALTPIRTQIHARALQGPRREHDWRRGGRSGNSDGQHQR